MYEITDDYLVMYEITDDFSAHRLHLSGASQKFADVQPIGSTPMSRLHDLVAACATHFLPSVFSSPRFTLLSSHQHPRPRPRRPHASPTFTRALVAKLALALFLPVSVFWYTQHISFIGIRTLL